MLATEMSVGRKADVAGGYPSRGLQPWYVPGTRVTESPEDMGYRFVYAMEGEFDHE